MGNAQRQMLQAGKPVQRTGSPTILFLRLSKICQFFPTLFVIQKFGLESLPSIILIELCKTNVKILYKF